MSEKFIPEHIDPFRYAEQTLALDGYVKVADMERLRANLSGVDEKVAVSLQFGRDEQGLAFIKGHIKANLLLQCQRCMEPYNYEIISDFVVGIVTTLDEANALPEHYEPALTKEGHLALRELIEDELILNLPIIPRHEPEQCKVKLPIAESGFTSDEEGNPFNVLKTLKNSGEFNHGSTKK